MLPLSALHSVFFQVAEFGIFHTLIQLPLCCTVHILAILY